MKERKCNYNDQWVRQGWVNKMHILCHSYICSTNR